MNINFVQSCEVLVRKITRCLLVCGSLPSGENVGIHVAEELLNLGLPNLGDELILEKRNSAPVHCCPFFCDSALSFLYFLVPFNVHQKTSGLLHPDVLPLQAEIRLSQAPYMNQRLQQ